MQTMSELFATGHIIDLILVFVALEAGCLVAWRAISGRGPALLPLLCNLLSGVALMLAVRSALTGAAWPIVAGCLAGSLISHVVELTLRLRPTDQGILPAREHGTTAESVAFSGRPIS